MVKRIISWTITLVLVLVIAGLGLIYFVPGYGLYLVRSGSMTPAINVGDLIITGPMGGPISGEIKPGTVVTYERSNELITHRVQSINGRMLTTKGDATENPDPWLIALSDVRGVYLFKIPYVGFLTNFVQTKKGWFLTIIIPGALLVLWLVKDILKEAFSDA